MVRGLKPTVRKAALLGVALASGAGGLAAESLLLSCLGLVVGYDRSAALGLAVWLAGWAVGAWWAGRRGAATLRRDLLLAGLCAGIGIAVAALLIQPLASLSGSGLLRTLLVIPLVALAAVPQGFFLPLLARSWDVQRGGARARGRPPSGGCRRTCRRPRRPRSRARRGSS